MARVTLGGSLRNTIQVRKRAAWYAYNFFVFSGILTEVRTATLPSQAVDTSLPPAGLIADSVKRSSRAHMFHFYSLLCEIASVPRKAPSAWISADRLAILSGVPAEKEWEMETAATSRTHYRSNSRPGPGHLDGRALARECLKEVGRELGVPR